MWLLPVQRLYSIVQKSWSKPALAEHPTRRSAASYLQLSSSSILMCKEQVDGRPILAVRFFCQCSLQRLHDLSPGQDLDAAGKVRPEDSSGQVLVYKRVSKLGSKVECNWVPYSDFIWFSGPTGKNCDRTELVLDSQPLHVSKITHLRSKFGPRYSISSDI